MATFAIGDIHGRLKALEQCLERSQFDKTKDRLICLGDVADRGTEVPECFELLMSIEKLVFIMGNHDYSLLQWFQDKEVSKSWEENYSFESKMAYYKKPALKKKHAKFLKKAKYYHIDKKGRLYLHGGFIPSVPLETQMKENPQIFCWDRSLWNNAANGKKAQYRINENSAPVKKPVFIGHTNTRMTHPDLLPVKRKNIWNLDQGAGHGAKLTIMKVKTEEYWQSDRID